MRQLRAVFGFVAPLGLAAGLAWLDFPRALPVEPYADGVTPVYLDRPYVNATPDAALAGFRIVRLPRHLRFEVEVELSAPGRALRLLGDENDAAPSAGWEPVDARVRVDGRSCVLTRAVAKPLAAGVHRLPPGGPVAAEPLLVAAEGEIRARTTSGWNKLTPGAGALDFVARNETKLGLLGLAWAGWCAALWRLRQRSSAG